MKSRIGTKEPKNRCWDVPVLIRNRPPRRPCVWPLGKPVPPTLLGATTMGEQGPGHPRRHHLADSPASAVRTCSARRKPRRPCRGPPQPRLPPPRTHLGFCVSPSPVSGCVWGQRMPAGSADTDRPPRSCWSSSATSRSCLHASASLSPLLPSRPGWLPVAGVVAWSARRAAPDAGASTVPTGLASADREGSRIW